MQVMEGSESLGDRSSAHAAERREESRPHTEKGGKNHGLLSTDLGNKRGVRWPKTEIQKSGKGKKKWG